MKQWPLYAEQAKLHELRPKGSLLSLKAHSSILFGRLFPETFIGMLAQATQQYASELAALDPPASQQAFWDYVIAQERAQAEAFQHASQQDYSDAYSVLIGFMEDTDFLEKFGR